MSNLLEVFPARTARHEHAKAQVSERGVGFVRRTLHYKLRQQTGLSAVDQHLLKNLPNLDNRLFAPSVGSVALTIGRALVRPSLLVGIGCVGIIYLAPLDRIPLESLAVAAEDAPPETDSVLQAAAPAPEIFLPDLAVALASDSHRDEPALQVLPPTETAPALPLPQPEAEQPKPLKAATLTKADQKLWHQRNLVKFISGIIAAFRPSIKDSGTVARYIVELSATENVDPIYVAAVIAIESRFSSSAQSPAGAMGLMQLMPMTAKEVAKSHKHRTSHLVDPRTNIKLGISYLKQLEEKYRGNRYLALAAYNWGPTNVDRSRGRSSRIPGSVRKYSNTVLERTVSWNRHFSKANESAEALQTVERDAHNTNS